MSLLVKLRRYCLKDRYLLTCFRVISLVLIACCLINIVRCRSNGRQCSTHSEEHRDTNRVTKSPLVTSNVSIEKNATAQNIPKGQHRSNASSNDNTAQSSNSKPIFQSKKWTPSSLKSAYHHYYAVDCPAVIRGEREAIREAKRVLSQSSRQIPGDTAVKDWTRDCGQYRKARGYPAVPLSEEEADYPIAYVILTHKDSSQFERLLRAVYQPQNVYCVHPDAKSPAPFEEAVQALVACFPNVFIASEPVKVNYAHSSRLQADINCMSDLLFKRPEPWNYVINLCAQDFPLKTNLEIVHQLKAFLGHNDIPGVIAPKWFDHRTRVHHEFRQNMMVKLPDIKKPPPPEDFKFYFGTAYYVATRGFVEYVLHNATAINLLKYSEDTYSPDEHYWVTLNRIPGVPGGFTGSSWNGTARFVHWKGTSKTPECVGKYVRDICIFGAGYVPFLARDYHLFANKFYMSYDPIAMQCIEELLDYRSANPDTLSYFVKDFPHKHLFGLG